MIAHHPLRPNETPEALAADPEVRKALERQRRGVAPRVAPASKLTAPKPKPVEAAPQGEEAIKLIRELIESNLALHSQVIVLRARVLELERHSDRMTEARNALLAHPEFGPRIERLVNRGRTAETADLRFAAVRFLYEQGFSREEIATFFKRDRSTILYALRRTGVEL